MVLVLSVIWKVGRKLPKKKASHSPLTNVSLNIYYCMSGRAIQETIQHERWQYWPDRRERQYRVSRAGYFPTIVSAIVYLLYDFLIEEKVKTQTQRSGKRSK